MNMIDTLAGQHFDPELVPLFLAQADDVRDIYEQYKESTPVGLYLFP